MAYSRWLINNRNEYLTFPEAETSKILKSEWLSYRGHLLMHRWCLTVVFALCERKDNFPRPLL